MAASFLTYKLLGAAVLFLVTFVSACIPSLIKSRARSGWVIGVCNCFTGGVVLGVAMLHVLPNLFAKIVVDGIEAHLNYPVGALAAAFAFLLTFGLDRLILAAPPNSKADDGQAQSQWQAIVFTIAMSVHSFFEGLGMGGINKKQELVSFFIGLVSHKGLEGFAEGNALVDGGFSSRVTFGLNFLYSSLTPLGIILSTMWSGGPSSSYSEQILVVVFKGLSLGSLLFVGCFEIISPEFETRDETSLAKSMALVLGLLFMAGMVLLEPVTV